MSEAMLRLAVEEVEEGVLVGTSPDVPGLVAEGRSVTEVVEIAQDLVRKMVDVCLEYGDPLPPALAISEAKLGAVELLIPVGVR